MAHPDSPHAGGHFQPLERNRNKKEFAIKNVKSEKPLFTLVSAKPNTRQVNDLVREPKCRTNRFKDSSLPFLANLLNTTNKKK